MSKIRDKAKLLDRAKEHRRLDHILQGTYGNIKFLQNGEAEVTEWKGCAISCLATETTVEGLFKQEAQGYFNVVNCGETEDGRTLYDVDCESSTLRAILSNDFNICEKLVWLAEIIFEGSDEDYAKDWPVKFVEAIPEDVDITNEDVDIFWNHVVERGLQYVSDFPMELDPWNYVNESGTWDIDDYFELVDYEDGEMLIDWLKSLAVTRSAEVVAA